MKKSIIILALLLLLLPTALAETTISQEPVASYVFKEMNVPALYDITVTNNANDADNFYIDTYLDAEITPKKLGVILPEETKTFRVEILPSQAMRDKYVGQSFAFEYFVRGDEVKLAKSAISLKMLSLPDTVDIIFPPAVDTRQMTVPVQMGLKYITKLDTNVKVSSDMVNEEFQITLAKEKKDLTFKLASDAADKPAGVYDVNFDFTIGNETSRIVKELVVSPFVKVPGEQVETGGILMKMTTVKKVNSGNSPTKVLISLNRSVISSLFTTFSESPRTQKVGAVYTYEWEKELNPGESYEVYLKTNYYMPFLIFLLIVIAVVIYRVVTQPPIMITKKVARVRTKSGVFASKIVIYMKNVSKHSVSNVKVIDRIPAFTEILPNKFGVVTPSEIKKRTVLWSFPQLMPQEEIMFSYVVYSQVNVFGKLEIPPAVVTFIDHKQDFREAHSDKIYILSEEEKKEEPIDTVI